MSFDDDRNTWGSAVEAARVLACDPKQVPKLAAKGFITVRRLPGCDPRYLISDVERLASQATVPATFKSRRAHDTADAVVTECIPTETDTATCKNGGKQ